MGEASTVPSALPNRHASVQGTATGGDLFVEWLEGRQTPHPQTPVGASAGGDISVVHPLDWRTVPNQPGAVLFCGAGSGALRGASVWCRVIWA